MNTYSINCHSSIKIITQVGISYFDPYKITDETHDADVIFITHSHYDHFSPDDINKIIKPDTVLVCPKTCLKDLKKAGYENIITGSAGEKNRVSGFDFECVPAYNIGKKFHPKENGWLGYVVNVCGEKIYVAGDTDALTENVSIECDTAFVPVGGTYTMTFKEAADFINKMKPKTAVPTHYGSIVGKKEDGESFKALVNGEINVKILID